MVCIEQYEPKESGDTACIRGVKFNCLRNGGKEVFLSEEGLIS